METGSEVLREIREIRKEISLINERHRYQTIPDAAITLGLPYSTVRRLVLNGVLPVTRTGKKGFRVDIIKANDVIQSGAHLQLIVDKHSKKI